MAGETQLTIVGNLTRDPAHRIVGTTPMVEITIASTPRIFDRQANQWIDGETTFLDCEVWGDLAYEVESSGYKGLQVIALVNLTQHSWTDRETQAKRSKMVGKVIKIGPTWVAPRREQQPASADAWSTAPVGSREENAWTP